MLVISNSIKGSSGKCFIARITCPAENQFSVDVLKNTTGINPVCTRTNLGNYMVEGFGHLDQSKVIFLSSGGSFTTRIALANGGPFVNVITIINYDINLAQVDTGSSVILLIIEILD